MMMTTSTTPFVAPLEPQFFFKPSSHTPSTHWQLAIEASCWLRSLSKDSARIEFVIEYRDAIRIRRKQIDTLDSSFFQDCLLSGRFQLEGYGDIECAQVTVESSGPLELYGVEVKLVDYQNVLHRSSLVESVCRKRLLSGPVLQRSTRHRSSLTKFLLKKLVA